MNHSIQWHLTATMEYKNYTATLRLTFRPMVSPTYGVYCTLRHSSLTTRTAGELMRPHEVKDREALLYDLSQNGTTWCYMPRSVEKTKIICDIAEVSCSLIASQMSCNI